jgi:hypothetical protein
LTPATILSPRWGEAFIPLPSPRWGRGEVRGDTAVTFMASFSEIPEEIMDAKFVVTETTTHEDILAAGRPDPLYCKPGLAQHACFLADVIDAELGGETSCGGAGFGYVPEVLEIE